MRFVKGDGSQYSIHHFYLNINIPGFEYTFYGGEELPSGTRTTFKGLKPELRYDKTNRRLLGGKLHFIQQDNSMRTLDIEVPGEAGFHLGAGLYFGYKGHHHGSWRGESHIEGEYIQDCSVYETAKELHQIRDCIIRVNDNGVIGYANYQTIINGEWPELGLTAKDSFI